jgi:hypothetical protein
LVQTDSKHYAFGGPDELRFRYDMPETPQRIGVVEALLAKLANPPAPLSTSGKAMLSTLKKR